MKIISTSLILIFTLLVVPAISYFFGTPPGEAEWRAIWSVATVMLIASLYSFIVGELTGNNSQVDKLWSLLPIVYVWIIAGFGDFSPRLVIMGILVTIWGARLTANFAMKGAYQWRFWEGEEDYRWQVLRKKPEFNPRWKWTLFNLFFISGYQHVLILLFTLPAIVALQYNHVPLNSGDSLVAFFMLAFIVYETIADIQHWKFQNVKHTLIKEGKPLSGDYQKGFLDKGLWAWSRHPNYFAEQAIWVCFYLFSISSGGDWLNWSITGCLLLIILFIGSSNFSEEISAGKYPEYARYQRRVARFIPFFKFYNVEKK